MPDRRPTLTGNPERIFVSVDETSGRSTLSFAPPGIGTPITDEADPRGAQALVRAREIAAAYPGCTIVGPHFHAASSTPRRTKRGPR